MQQGGTGGLSGEYQETARCGSSQNTGRMGNVGAAGKRRHNVREEVGKGDAGGDGVRKAGK